MNERERRQADGVLRLLLQEADPRKTLRRVGWDGLAPLARRHGVLLRVADCLASVGEMGPSAFEDAVDKERQRVRSSLSVIRRLGSACEQHRILFLFPKSFQHLPDLGSDIDLVIASDSPAIDEHVFDTAGLRARRNAINRLTGATTYEIEGCPSLLDVQRGRLGRLGEDVAFAGMMLAGAGPHVIDGTVVRIPSAEHALILQGMQRILGRTYLRLSDLVCTIRLLRRDSLNWAEVVETSRRLGVFESLACYLSYVDQVHREVLSGPRLPVPAVLAASRSRWGRLEFHAGSYRFPALRVNGALYLMKLRAEVRRQNWRVAGRLCLAPVVAVTSMIRRAFSTAASYIAASGESRALPSRFHLGS